MLLSLWKGSTFAEIMNMTDIFEGSIIRSARRLDEFLNQVTLPKLYSLSAAITFSVKLLMPFLIGVLCVQLRLAAEAVGENNLASKFAAASESLRRGIMFANSLYL